MGALRGEMLNTTACFGVVLAAHARRRMCVSFARVCFARTPAAASIFAALSATLPLRASKRPPCSEPWRGASSRDKPPIGRTERAMRHEWTSGPARSESISPASSKRTRAPSAPGQVHGGRVADFEGLRRVVCWRSHLHRAKYALPQRRLLATDLAHSPGPAESSETAAKGGGT